MKKLILFFYAILLLTGCTNLENHFEEYYGASSENQHFEQEFIYNEKTDEPEDLFANYPNLNENLKDQLSKLSLLWKKFDEGKNQEIDPTEDFHKSDYIAELKKFLAKKESLEVSENILASILEQHGFETFGKTILVNEKKLNIRVISYNVDYYVKAITDHVGLKNNWTFIQCWNDEEYYFATVSDGDMHITDDFLPLVVDGNLDIILVGHSFPGYPQPPFLWAWQLGSNGFKEINLFNLSHDETDRYLIDNIVDFFTSINENQWTIHTNGSFLFVEKRSAEEGSDSWTSDYLNISCEIDETKAGFTFTSIDRTGNEDSTIRIKLKNNKFIVE